MGGPAVGVVGRVDVEVGLPDVAVPAAGLLERVDDRRVGLEGHPLLQPVVEDGRNQGPLVGPGKAGARYRPPKDPQHEPQNGQNTHPAVAGVTFHGQDPRFLSVGFLLVAAFSRAIFGSSDPAGPAANRR